MKVEKAYFGVEGDRVSLAVPLSKVDKENRIVSGFATLDSVDTQDDIVTAEASVAAFSKFRGNIRLMHQPIPAGKVVNFREEEFYDTETKKFYRGVYVDTYISKGAPNVWEMVIDGTLTGFSIGGNITKAETQFVKDADGGQGRNIRFIKEYELVELSLVDSPANQMANIVSVTKAQNGDTIVKAGTAIDTVIENVFYCATDEMAKATTEDAADCAACGKAMVNIGWFESEGDRAEKVQSVIAKYNSKVITTRDFERKSPENNEGGVDVADEKKELGHGEHEVEGSEVVVDNATAEDLAEEVEEVKPTEDEAEKAAEVSEVGDVEPDFEKMLSEVRESVQETIAKGAEATEVALAALTERIEKATTEFDTKFSELAKNHSELSEKFSGLKNELSSVEKRVDGVEDETAVKKSGDLGGSTEDSSLQKSKKGSVWGGRFSVSDL